MPRLGSGENVPDQVAVFEAFLKEFIGHHVAFWGAKVAPTKNLPDGDLDGVLRGDMDGARQVLDVARDQLRRVA